MMQLVGKAVESELYSLRKPKVFALQILQRYLTKQGRVGKFFHCLYG